MAKEKQFILENDGFLLKKERYPYTDVRSLGFVYLQTQKNFGASGVDHNVMLDIHLHSKSQHLSVTSGPQALTWYGATFGKKSSELLIAKYSELCSRTFQQRLRPYLNSLDTFGFFIYDEKKIFKNGDVVAKKWTKNLSSDKPWLRAPFQIFCEDEKKRFLARKKRYEIHTSRDQDVFFALLKTLFHLSWANTV